MSRKNQPTWTPPAEHAALLPEFTGNAFNGWGEATPRRPRQIFWLRRSEGHPYGRLLDAVKQHFVSVPAYRDVYALADRGPGKLPPPAENRRVASADSWTRAVKDFVLDRPGARPEGYPGAGSEAELVGITAIRPEWVYEGFECTLPNLIVVGNAMDHAPVESAVQRRRPGRPARSLRSVQPRRPRGELAGALDSRPGL
jgi:hypothetical protein